MSFGMTRDGGSCTKVVFMDVHSLTAGAATDNSEQTGPWVDRQGWDSIAVYAVYEASMATGETLSIAANLQDSVDGSTAKGDFTLGGDSLVSTVVATAADSPTETVRSVAYLGKWDLTLAERYIRAQVTSDLSASGTDTATVTLVGVLHGGDTFPAQTPLND